MVAPEKSSEVIGINDLYLDPYTSDRKHFNWQQEQHVAQILFFFGRATYTAIRLMAPMQSFISGYHSITRRTNIHACKKTEHFLLFNVYLLSCKNSCHVSCDYDHQSNLLVKSVYNENLLSPWTVLGTWTLGWGRYFGPGNVFPSLRPKYKKMTLLKGGAGAA